MIAIEQLTSVSTGRTWALVAGSVLCSIFQAERTLYPASGEALGTPTELSFFMSCTAQPLSLCPRCPLGYRIGNLQFRSQHESIGQIEASPQPNVFGLGFNHCTASCICSVRPICSMLPWLASSFFGGHGQRDSKPAFYIHSRV